MEEETMSVEPSAEQGNVPLDAPSEQPVVATVPVEETKEAVKPTEPQLYDLPDGRKVNGETLAKEWKDNFLPEFTRKSQALADIEKAKNENKPTIENPYAKPDYTPQTYDEVIEEAKNRAIREIKAQQESVVAQQQAVETEVVNQLAELRKTDPNLNENALFLHANEYKEKYGVSFPDLKSAYTHLKDVAELTKNVQQTTVKNIQKHADPVSSTQGRATGALPNPSHFSSARDYLQAVKGSQ